MAAQGARVAAELGVTRAVQDEFAYQSHKRAFEAHEAGRFDAELVPIRVASKAKGKIVVDALPQPARAQDVVLDLDASRSTVDFTLGAFLHTVHGSFKFKSGTIRLDPASAWERQTASSSSTPT